MDIDDELLRFQRRLRAVREAQGLTLSQVAVLSSGAVSAIALGSYERGDRSMSAAKVLEIAKIYKIPVSELFEQPQKMVGNKRVVIDYRKLSNDDDPIAQLLLNVINKIASIRRDWNGELISLRESDIASLQIFTLLTGDEIDQMLKNYLFYSERNATAR
jgi:transcriptional regulator with XRE-family HTH domain